MDCAIFISLNDDTKKIVIEDLLILTMKYYNYIYIIYNPDNTKLNVKFNRLIKKNNYMFKQNHSNSTTGDSTKTINFIKNINPKIHIYSHRVGIGCDTVLFEQEKQLNVHVDYTNIKNPSSQNDLIQIVVKSNIFLGNIKPFDYEKSVIVFDLDDTLISKNGEILFCNMPKIINGLRQVFDLIVLWSHGNSSHVNSALLLTLKDVKFDSVIVLDKNSKFESDVYAHNKGVGKLFRVINQEHGVGKLKLTALVDDQSGNFIGDYDLFSHVPNTIDGVNRAQQIVKLIQTTKDVAYKTMYKQNKSDVFKFNFNHEQ